MNTTQKIIVALSSSMLMLATHAQTPSEASAEPKSGSAPAPIRKVEQSVARGAHVAADGIEHGMHKVAQGVERGAQAVAHGVERGAQATASAAGRVANKLGGSSASATSSGDQ